ncbi:MAG: hypothetical protein ACE5DM_00680 [Candidatus Nanoarchaeia archaeon]
MTILQVTKEIRKSCPGIGLTITTKRPLLLMLLLPFRPLLLLFKNSTRAAE